MAEKISKNAIFWFFLTLFLVFFFLLGKLLWPFASVLVLGAVTTGIARPVYTRLCRRLRPGWSSFLVCLMVFLVLFVPFVLFVGILSREALGLYQMGRNAVISNEVQALLKSTRILEIINPHLAFLDIHLTGEQLNQVLSESGKTVGLFLYQQASAIASNALNFLIYFFFMILVTYYLLIDGDRLISFIIDLSPLPTDQEEQLIQKFKEMGGAVLLGNGFCGLIQGVAGGVAFGMFGLKSPFLWGVIMGILAFLPILGIGLVLIPTAVFLFLKGYVGAGLFFIVFYVVLSFGVEYLIKPKLVGQRVKMHTLLVFLAILGGLKVFGILGIIYGPLVVTGFLTLTDIYHSSYQQLIEDTHPRI